jgi:hypothetical protein
MKGNILLLPVIVLLAACGISGPEKLKKKVSSYIKQKVANPKSYKPLHFSTIDTVYPELLTDTSEYEYKTDYNYSIDHIYEIENSERQKVIMSISFYFDSTGKITEAAPEGLNGNYGSLNGNVYWKYNNFVGNKPDAGSSIKLYSLDTLRTETEFETTADVMGNFSFEKLLPGTYCMIVRSKNTTDSPDGHFRNIQMYPYILSKVFKYNFDIQSLPQWKEYKKIDSISNAYYDKYLKDKTTYSEFYKLYNQANEEKATMAGEILLNIPVEYRSKIGLYSLFSNKLDISLLYIDEGKSKNKVIDFGITYY